MTRTPPPAEARPAPAPDAGRVDAGEEARSALRALWKRAPAPARRRFWLTVFAARRAVLPLRIALVWRRGRARGAPGVEVAGLFRDTRGVAQAARLFADALEAGGTPVVRRDAGAPLGVRPVLAPPPAPSGAGAGVVVTCLNPPELLRWLDATGGAPLRGRRHIGYWAWELPQAPPAWAKALRYVDEVWCHSDFAAGAIRALAPDGPPVRTVRLPVFAARPAPPDRTRFGLAPDACVVLCVMDLRSTSARKNPLGALAAYSAAQPQPDDRTVLVCKLSGLDSETAAAEAIRQAAALRPDIRLITQSLDEGDMHALVACADVVLSLHRAEGFGLLVAEAAWLGKAVVTTGWSAPLEFLSPQGAALVGWRPIPVEDDQALYGGAQAPGATWADPDLQDAAGRLRELIADPAERARMGAAAAAHARVVFDPAAWIAQVRAALG